MATVTELLTSKIPPHSLEAERAVLGAILLEKDSLPKAVEILKPTDFYKEGHRKIFDSMIALFERSEPVDLLTLREELRRRGDLEEVGGEVALATMVEEAATAAHLLTYAGIVREKALLRDLIRIATEIVGLGYEARDQVDVLLDQAEERIFRLSERRMQGSAIPVRSILKETFEYIEHLYERKEQVTGLATGIRKLDLMTSGLQPSDFIIVAGRPSMGKAQPLDARVKTLTGWKRMGDLRVGDALASVDGRRSLASGIFPQGARQVYRVTFSDGRSTECTGDHLWRVHYREWPGPRVLTTDRVAEMLLTKRYRHRLWIDLPSGEYGRSDAPPIDPWLLGCLLGDGKLSGSSLQFSTSEQEMLEQVRHRAGPGFVLRAAGGYDWRIVQAAGAHRQGVAGVAPNTVMDALRSLRLWGIRSEEKFIPDIFLNASREARVDLLRGLLDTDGWVERWGSVRFCSASERLAQNVAELVRSLGGWCTVRSRETTYLYRSERKAGKQAFVCNVHHPNPRSILQLSLKRSRALSAPQRRRRPVFVSIEPTRVTDTQCISVTHPSGLYITDDYIVTHNTSLALNIARNATIELHRTVLILTLEMSKEQLVQRLLCAEAKVASHRVRTGYLEPRDWPKLTSAAGRLAEARIYIDDQPALSVLEARAKARRVKAEHGLDLVIVDYLQLMRGRSAENRQQEISDISRSLKALAKELRVPVMALSQLSRAVEARAQRDYRPQLSDLRECVTGETLVVLADGRRVPIKDLVGMAPEVLAVSSERKIIAAKTEKIWRVGKRPVFSIRLASGRAIRATERHQLLETLGWTRVAELSVGDRIAVARRLPEPAFPDSWSDLRVARLGQLIGDGRWHQLETVGAFGPCEPQARRLEALLAACRADTDVDARPREDFEQVKKLMSLRALMAEDAEIFGHGERYARATGDLFWDRIVAIEADGEEEVFDLTVPGPASWLADGIVSHNSGALEQDADLIMFLYRPSRYGIQTEEGENYAEVLVEKQRNGPTGKVPVVFIPEYASFENIADEHRGPF